ncbi:HAMP domain-containing sensor histidine kinase [Streptomyces sp. NPDC050844]|uniref:sensor histidine kinase n=1 Tax=Streptomyces sp. NPDC050844 TaxID=3155790 RepID=UPI0033D6E7CD
MRSRSARTLTPTARVRRLRRRITALFALTSAAGLIGLAVFAVHSDDRRWRQQLDQSMGQDTSWAIGLLITDEDGRLDARELADTMGTGCPPLTVLSVPPGDESAPLTVEHAPRRPCLTVSSSDLQAAGAAAVRGEHAAAVDRHTTDGRPVRLYADPFYPPEPMEPDAPQGVIVTMAGTADQRADHRRLTWLVAGACAVLVCLSAAVGHLLSGRAIRPALAALRQQEAFLADAAHDLRTPAASLRSLAETALRGETDSTEVLRRSLRLADGMGGLVDGLLTRARLMSGTETLVREPLRLDQLVEGVVADAPAEGHRVTLRLEETVVVADPDLVRRAVGNLLGNALVHGHAPGEPAEVVVTVSPDGAVTVEDAGPGLPPRLAEGATLFDRFRSGGSSTGLGLSIAAWVAHAHGGDLTAGPASGGGARFVLRLPLA